MPTAIWQQSCISKTNSVPDQRQQIEGKRKAPT